MKRKILWEMVFTTLFMVWSIYTMIGHCITNGISYLGFGFSMELVEKLILGLVIYNVTKMIRLSFKR